MIPVRTIVAVCGACMLTTPAMAADALIAVAANFARPAQRVANELQQTTGHRSEISIGSTGKLYAQIINGAPFDAFLAADQARPARLEDTGRAVAGSRVTYAAGTLLLWSADPQRIGRDGPAALRDHEFGRLAIAHPHLAPYGQAARTVLVRLGLWDALQDRIVRGENIAQAFAMTASGNAQLGFIAAAQRPDYGSGWDVPATWHEPIRQDAVLLEYGRDNGAARAFLDYLVSDPVQNRLATLGYGSNP